MHGLEAKQQLEFIEEHVVLTVIADGIETPPAANRASRTRVLKVLEFVQKTTEYHANRYFENLIKL